MGHVSLPLFYLPTTSCLKPLPRNVIYVVAVIIGSTLLIRDTGSSSVKLYKRGAKLVQGLDQNDSEAVQRIMDEKVGQHAKEGPAAVAKDMSCAPVFTFKASLRFAHLLFFAFSVFP